jgi:hypothetical protein
MSKRLRQVEGTLTDKGGGLRRVQLNVTTAVLSGSHGVEDEAIARVEIGSGSVPDGEYVLEYFCFQQHREPVRVKYGVLCAP